MVDVAGDRLRGVSRVRAVPRTRVGAQGSSVRRNGPRKYGEGRRAHGETSWITTA